MAHLIARSRFELKSESRREAWRNTLGKLRPEDKIECWVAIHAARHFRAPSEDEHAAFVASKDRDRETRTKRHAGRKRAKVEAGALG